MRQIELRQVKRGDIFRLKDSETAPLWVREDYDRGSRKYGCCKYDNINHFSIINGKRLVFVD